MHQLGGGYTMKSRKDVVSVSSEPLSGGKAGKPVGTTECAKEKCWEGDQALPPEKAGVHGLPPSSNTFSKYKLRPAYEKEVAMFFLRSLGLFDMTFSSSIHFPVDSVTFSLHLNKIPCVHRYHIFITHLPVDGYLS